ncbi:Hypothetical protein RY67_2300 [Bifidobacterium longum subsp. infantis]|uniref:Uncharacterized protein n=1 Tax=Bifidobacterium longum subsp. infantis TaxID=1682 RepID=A0A0M5KVP5_BIFLI|nr:Hypothetical protein RY67_2300 [Bifidobacterium longum subsp. infantis]
MGRGDGQAIIKTSRPETSRCTYKLNPGLLSNRGFHVQATENRTKAGPCPFHRNPQPNPRKKTGVIMIDANHQDDVIV